MPDLYRLTPEQLRGARRLRGDLGRQRRRGDPGIEGAAVLPRAARPQHPEDRLGARAQPRHHFGNVGPARRRRSQEELEQVEGIGSDRAELVAEWFAEDENLRLVEELRGSRACDSRRATRTKPVEGRALGPDLCHHGHARGVLARPGEGGARGARREGHRLGVDEDDRSRRGRGARRLEAHEGSALGRGTAHRRRSRGAAQWSVIVTGCHCHCAASAAVATQTSIRRPLIALPVSAATASP